MKKILILISILMTCIFICSCGAERMDAQETVLYSETEFTESASIDDQGQVGTDYYVDEETVEEKWIALVRVGEHKTIIDDSGQMIIQPTYKQIGVFPGTFAENGLACVVDDDGNEGYINANGEVVLSIGYGVTTNFGKNGLAVVERNGRFEIINDSGECLATKEYGELSNTLSGVEYAKNGLSSYYGDYINEKMGYMNEKGETVISPKFLVAMDFNDNGLALARVSRSDKYGYIDETGEFVIAPQFDEASYIFANNGTACVKLNGKYGFISETGNIVIDPQFDMAYTFSDSGIARVEIDDKYGYISEQGELIIPAQFDAAGDFSASGYAAVMIDGKYGFINESGEIVIDPIYDVAKMFSDNGLAYVAVGEKCGFINTNGEYEIPLQSTWTAEEYANGGVFQKVRIKQP